MKRYLPLLALLSFGVQLRAQASTERRCTSTCLDSAVYRPGRWGIDFLATEDVPTLGVFRLMTDRTAWIANITGSASTSSIANPSGAPGAVALGTHASLVQAALGLRRYRALAARSTVLAGVGVTAEWTRFKVDGFSETMKSHLVGPYLEAGAQYHLLPQIALGVNVHLTAVWGSADALQIDSFGRVTTESKPASIVSLEPARLALSIFF